MRCNVYNTFNIGFWPFRAQSFVTVTNMGSCEILVIKKGGYTPLTTISSHDIIVVIIKTFIKFIL